MKYTKPFSSSVEWAPRVSRIHAAVDTGREIELVVMKCAFLRPLALSQLVSVDGQLSGCRAWISRCLVRDLLQTPSVSKIGRYGDALRLSLSSKVWLASSIKDETFRFSAAFVTRARESRGREWQDYDEAVQNMDLGTALEILSVLNADETELSDVSGFMSEPSSGSLDTRRGQDNGTIGSGCRNFFEILDAAQTTLDLGLVGRAYDYLQVRGFLNNFGKCQSQASEGERVVTPSMMLETAGLNASKLSPKKWGLAGNSSLALLASFSFLSYLVNNEIDIRPVILLILGLGVADAIYLGGTGVGQVLSLWPPYRRRVLVHEAGHVLVAYLLGCPIRGVVLDAMQAMKMGIQGQAGTQFWDETLENELRQHKLTGASIDRYSIVLFAGIAAEALVYGEAEGGESDENLFKSVVSELQPPWSPAKMSNQARWAVLRAFTLIKAHRKAHTAVVEALERRAGLGSLIKTMEDAMS